MIHCIGTSSVENKGDIYEGIKVYLYVLLWKNGHNRYSYKVMERRRRREREGG
jgi:hypothetical protein